MKNKIKIRHTNEANCQANLRDLIRSYGFDADMEHVHRGYPESRLDIAIFNPAGKIVGVVECKNMKSYSGCVKRELDLQKEPQGIKYIEMSKKEGFKIFWCGGDARVIGCMREILKAFPWWVRLYWMIRSVI